MMMKNWWSGKWFGENLLLEAKGVSFFPTKRPQKLYNFNQ
jgi:hypothetical protein